jgi:hypothetical protein
MFASRVGAYPGGAPMSSFVIRLLSKLENLRLAWKNVLVTNTAAHYAADENLNNIEWWNSNNILMVGVPYKESHHVF